MSSKLRMQSQHAELRIMEFLNSIYLSGMAALENRDETPDLTIDQTYNATYKITRAEINNLVKFFANADRRSLRKKHRSAIDYAKQMQTWLQSFEAELDGAPEELERFCHGFVRLLKDMHNILNEDTQQKVRDSIVESIIVEAVSSKLGPMAYTGEEGNG